MSFFYNINGDDMIIYLDLLLVLNFIIDLLLLIAVSIVLRRNASINRLLIASFVGSFSIITLFLDINDIELFLFKLLVSILMVLISFGFHNLRYIFRNMFFLYTISIILGGFLYYLNIVFSYKQNDLVFIFKGYSINMIVLILISPIIIFVYIKQSLHLKNHYSNYYKVDIYLNNKIIKCNAFLDTGNRLKDPYTNKPIILVNKGVINDSLATILIPYNTINEVGLLKCINVSKIDIKGIGVKKDVLVGIMNNKIRIDGVDCILHHKLLEEK